MNIWHVIDGAPTLYLFTSGYALHALGQSLARRKPSLEYWQYAAGALTFTVLMLRRLIADSPEVFAGVVLVVLRGAAFGLIAYGLAGTLGVLVLVLHETFSRARWRVQVLRRQLDDRRCRAAQAKRAELLAAERPPIRDGAAERIQAEQREREARHQEEEQRRKQRERLRAELEMMFALDQDRREHFLSLIQSCDDAGLSADEYEDRIAMICEAISRYAPRRSKRFTSLNELMVYYDGRIAEIDESGAGEDEIEHLKALISMERQQAIGRLIQA